MRNKDGRKKKILSCAGRGAEGSVNLFAPLATLQILCRLEKSGFLVKHPPLHICRFLCEKEAEEKCMAGSRRGEILVLSKKEAGVKIKKLCFFRKKRKQLYELTAALSGGSLLFFRDVDMEEFSLLDAGEAREAVEAFYKNAKF